MTGEQLLDLDSVPQMWGQPLYPIGMPMRRESIAWIDGETLEDKWRKRLKTVTETDQEPDKDDEQLLVNWVLYYLHAPMWRWIPHFDEFMQPFLDELQPDITLEDLIQKCLEIGIDPF